MPLLILPDTGSSGLSERAKALVFEDPASRALLEAIQHVAAGEGPVLISGEPGTGRELVARHIHDLGLRARGPFLSVNCSSFAQDALEGELFGYHKDAAHGRTAGRAGWLEAAHGGTLFLDAVGDLPAATQTRLLRALQEHQLVRVGARRPRPIDVRLLVASDVELAEAVAAGHFRADLLRYLSKASLRIPRLCERPGDILPLARHFMQVYQQRIGIGARSLNADAERVLLEHDWPANIRELETVIHHALLRCHGRFVTSADLRLNRTSNALATSSEPTATLDQALQQLFAASPPNLHALVDETLLRSAYRFSKHNQLKTARLLGVSRNVVRARLIQYGEIAGVLRRTPLLAEGSKRELPRAARVVRIGYQRVGLLKLLRARGSLEAAFERLGFAVQWFHYPSGMRLVDAFRTCKIELGVVGEGPPIFAHATDIPIVYVAAEAPAPEGEAIVVQRESRLRSVRDLRGKRVALLRGSSAHYLLIRALEEAGVEYAQVYTRFLFQDAARLAFEHGQVDAWALADPALAELEQSGGARVLRDARGLAKNSAYYLASARFAEQHPELVELVRRELAAVASWASENIDAVAATYSQRLGISREALALTLRRGLGAPLRESELLASQQQVADAFYKLRLIPRPVSLTFARSTHAALDTRAPAANAE